MDAINSENTTCTSVRFGRSNPPDSNNSSNNNNNNNSSLYSSSLNWGGWPLMGSGDFGQDNNNSERSDPWNKREASMPPLPPAVPPPDHLPVGQGQPAEAMPEWQQNAPPFYSIPAETYQYDSPMYTSPDTDPYAVRAERAARAARAARVSTQNEEETQNQYDENGARRQNSNDHSIRFACMLLALTVCLLVCTAVGLSVLFIMGGHDTNDDGKSTATPPSPSPPTSPLQENNLALPLQMLEQIRDDPSSPQARAFAWIQEDNPSFFETDRISQRERETLRERYAIVTLFYALRIENSTTLFNNQSKWLDHDVHICDWWMPVNSTTNLCGEEIPRTNATTTTTTADNIRNNTSSSTDTTDDSKNSSSSNNNNNNIFQHSEDDNPSQRLRRDLQDASDDRRKVLQLLLAKQYLVGSIPVELGLLSSLRTIDFSNNAIFGQIPGAAFRGLANLERLYLADNLLTAEIPTDIYMVSSLLELVITNNQLNSTLPTQLPLLTKLQHLQLSNNKLTGTVLKGLKNWGSSLTTLALDHNRFTGVFPNEIFFLSNLQVLTAENNRLKGTLPTQLGLLTMLEDLILDNNDLQGPMPSEIGRMQQLKTLHLAGNTLSKNIPPEIQQLENLSVLDLDDNDLTGVIPSGLCSLERIEFDCGADLCGCHCDCDNTTNATTSIEEENDLIVSPAAQWHDSVWADLPTDIRNAFSVLGWNATLWNSGESSPAHDLAWADLSPEQKEAAAALGYGQDSWDNELVHEVGGADEDGNSSIVHETNDTDTGILDDIELP